MAAGRSRYMVEATTAAEAQLLDPAALWLANMRAAIAYSGNAHIGADSNEDAFLRIKDQPAGYYLYSWP